MTKIKLTTLTPVHIGSGVDFQGSFEYLYFKDHVTAVVIDQEKTLQVLGEDKVGDWVSCIEKKEDLLALLKTRKGNLQPEDVALRSIAVKHAGLSGTNSLREQLHDGMGRTLLPGSSLKGAVRTAIFAYFIGKNSDLVKKRNNLVNYKGKFSDAALITECFGRNPNTDFLRLLQVGDAFFGDTECYHSNVVNLGRDGWIKGSNDPNKNPLQFIEAIPANTSCTGVTFNLDEQLYKIAEAKNLFNGGIALLQPHRLFPLINDHTKSMVDREIEYWTGQGNPDAIENYLEELDNVLTQITACRENECVIRLGWGTGFRNMTGAWHGELSDDDYYDLVKSVRPKHPEDMVYPKTTRLLLGGMPLGYIRLSI